MVESSLCRAAGMMGIKEIELEILCTTGANAVVGGPGAAGPPSNLRHQSHDSINKSRARDTVWSRSL